MDNHGQLVGIGRRDGTASIADPRAPRAATLVASYAAHKGPVSHVAFQSLAASDGALTLATASVGGAIQLCDLRKPGTAYLMYRSHNICALAAHAARPVLAVGSRKQNLKLFNLHARRRGKINSHSDFWGSRIGQIACLAFHPMRALVAVGAANDHLSVFTYDDESWSDKIAM
mmetsp:Transcript_48750/g.128323  ORF Transcript_48750/g.128323 Transcript_48750/m.128323 type:complete len:173 (+) Transcript_48750:1-519(+)